MRILSSIVGAMIADMFRDEPQSPEGRLVGPKFVGYNSTRRETVLLEQLSHQPVCGFRIAPALEEEIQNFPSNVHGAPMPVAFFPNQDDHFIEVPVIAGPWTGTA